MNEQRRIVALLKGGEELRPFLFFGRTLMASVLDRAFRGEL